MKHIPSLHETELRKAYSEFLQSFPAELHLTLRFETLVSTKRAQEDVGYYLHVLERLLHVKLVMISEIIHAASYTHTHIILAAYREGECIKLTAVNLWIIKILWTRFLRKNQAIKPGLECKAKAVDYLPGLADYLSQPWNYDLTGERTSHYYWKYEQLKRFLRRKEKLFLPVA